MSLTNRELTLLMAAAIYGGGISAEASMDLGSGFQVTFKGCIDDAESLISEYDLTHKEE